jgi:hypothetical protein
LKVNYFRKSAGKVQETQVALSAKDAGSVNLR